MTYRLLLADDDPALRAVLRELCAPFFEILEADNGDTAFELALMERPDLALCDLHMPGRSGLEALAALKELDLRRPAILMTSDPTVELERQLRQAHIDTLLTKPFSRSKLLGTFACAIEDAFHDESLRQRLLSM